MTNLSLANVTESNTISWKLPLTHSILALEFKFQNIHIKPKKKNHNFFYGKKKKIHHSLAVIFDFFLFFAVDIFLFKKQNKSESSSCPL